MVILVCHSKAGDFSSIHKAMTAHNTANSNGTNGNGSMKGRISEASQNITNMSRLLVADLRLKRGWISFLIYPFTPMVMIDTISMLPLFAPAHPALQTLRLVRLARVLRAYRVVRHSQSVTIMTEVFKKQQESLASTATLAGGYVLICALAIFNVEPQTFDTFFDAVYWAVISLTTVGYGDLSPTTPTRRLVAIASTFAGIAVIALPSGIITAGLMNKLNDKDMT